MNTQEQMKKAFIERYIKPEDAHNAGVSLEGILSQAIQTEREELNKRHGKIIKDLYENHVTPEMEGKLFVKHMKILYTTLLYSKETNQ